MNAHKEDFSVVTHETADGRQMTGIFDMDATMSDPDLPISVWIKIPIKQPDQRGLSADTEAERLDKIEDEIESLISGRFVGRITFDGVRELYFYVKDAVATNTSLVSLRDTSSYEFEFEIIEDSEWKIIKGYLEKVTPQGNPRQQERYTDMGTDKKW